MNLLTKTQFAKHAGKSPPAVSKALKQGRLELFQDTGKINTGSPKSQAFCLVVGKGQKDLITGITGINGSIEGAEDLTDAALKLTLAQEQKIIEEAELKKQQRIKTELQNAILRGEYVRVEAINQSLMMWIDRQLNTNKRYFSAMFDEIERSLLQAGEKVEGLKQKFLNEMEESADDAKNVVCDKIEVIQNEQATGKG